MLTRSLLFTATLLSTAGLSAQSSGQFQFTMMDGRSIVRMLPSDWTPRFEKAFIYLTPRDRYVVSDIASVRPVHPDDVKDQHQVKLLFRNQLGHGSQVFWVPNAYAKLEDAPHENGFIVLGPQTLIREGIYREVLE